MDRRYSGMRFYDGTRASDNASKKADDLVRRYMSNINRARRASENYGGSTGGRKSLDRNTGLKVIQQRQDAQRDARDIFEKEGIGRFGARKEAYIAKQFDDEGSSGILGIGGRDAEPMTREEFDAYVKEKGYATGGRAAFMAGGMGRRGFLKMLAGLGGGIAAAKTGLLKLAGKEPAKQVAKEVVQQSASTPPPYFFKLAEKIKTLGRVTDGPQERLKIHTMPAKDGKSELMLTEDLGTGEMQIKKIGKEGDEMVTEVQTMDYTPGSSQADETTQGIPADQYDEYTEFNSRIYKDEFNDPDIVEGIKVDEIIEEVKDQAPSIKKAGGGIARMLGE